MAIVVLGDSLCFHGPERAEPLDDRRLWPNLVAAELGLAVEVFARQGWTARDAWWALTRDPRLWPLLPRAEVVVLAVGCMDMLPTAVPSYLRLGISHLPTEGLREVARRAYLAVNPRVVRWTGGPLRTLSQRQTDAYLTRIVEALAPLRPDLPVVTVACPAYESPYYPGGRNHAAAARAARAWGERLGVPVVAWDEAVARHVPSGLNPDGMHWGWEAHADVAAVTAEVLRPLVAGALS